jgi:hypothetical protein
LIASCIAIGAILSILVIESSMVQDVLSLNVPAILEQTGIARSWLHRAYILLALLLVGWAMGEGILNTMNSERQKSRAPRTHDTELLSWWAHPLHEWAESGLDSLLVYASNVILLLPVVSLVFYIVTWPNQQNNLFWGGGILALFAAFLAGVAVSYTLLRTRFERRYAILDTGIIADDSFYPWGSFSWFEANSYTGIVRTYSHSGPSIRINALPVPEPAIFQQAVSLLEKHLPTTPPVGSIPWYRQRAVWWVFASIAALIGIGWMVGSFLIIPAPSMACLSMATGSLIWLVCFMLIAKGMTGVDILEEGFE